MSKIEESAKKEIIMVPLNAISRFRWDKNCGLRLKQYRDKISRARLAGLVADKLGSPSTDSGGRLREDSCSSKYIQRLEEAQILSISTEVLTMIAEILEIRIDDLLDINLSIETHR
jgi:hypothetical protein